MQLRIDHRGQVVCLYGETIDLTTLGSLSIQRASHVEPDEAGCWWVDLTPRAGTLLGPFQHRSQALAAERNLLHKQLFADGREP